MSVLIKKWAYIASRWSVRRAVWALNGLTQDLCYTIIVSMKNITITLKEDVARWLRVWAAEHEVSVSRMISNMLTARMEHETEYETAMRRFLQRKPVMLKKKGEAYPKRDELYDRPILRR